MSKYEYEVVPFIGQMKGKQSAATVSGQLKEILNKHAAHGWEFVQVADVSIEVQPGCLAGLFGAKTAYMQFDQVVFRRVAS